MIILPKAGLVFLEVPKTASTSMRAMLAPFATKAEGAPRHMTAGRFERDWRARIEAALGGPVETFCVLRDPLARAQSWYRFRQREKLRGQARSTEDLSFADFVLQSLQDRPPPAADIGRQDRFCGFDGRHAAVDHLFDFARMGLLTDFLSARLDQSLRLPQRNLSPLGAGAALPKAVVEAHRAARAQEYALYATLAEHGGHWRGRGP